MRIIRLDNYGDRQVSLMLQLLNEVLEIKFDGFSFLLVEFTEVTWSRLAGPRYFLLLAQDPGSNDVKVTL